MVDWNNDGKKDLVIGNCQGAVKLYLNNGTNAQPVFGGYILVKDEGVSDGHFGSSPEVVDLDGDGNKDLLVGIDNGYVYFYCNTETDTNPSFSNGIKLTAGSYFVYVLSHARIEAVDWDEDGDIDLLVGERRGYVNLFLNTGNVSDVKNDNFDLSKEFILNQNYPNPFNRCTEIVYQIPQSGRVQLSIFDMRGRLVRKLVDSFEEAGSKNVIWDGLNSFRRLVSTGVYIYKLQIDDYMIAKKMVFQK